MGSEQATGRPPIEGQITFFYYADIGQAEAFYGATLGLEKIFDRGWVKFFRITGTARVGLVDEAHGHHPAAGPKSVMLSIETPDLEGWYARARAGGAEFQKHLDLENPTNSLVNGFLLRDPGGYSVEFFRFNAPLS
ncbi:VOC family protein [Nitratireductor sp. ZSWI3]|uniref:VOC family protein n=1 Tax=Nitratireductor sp. ZSWI3 TaxID=2966359 RepID=UPI00215014EF|nr:VOC family protein [Nitratireductor sp. ZSWI3]MCR4265556.1 VOC family protein [Nitratireductor sp. ZSWI3]